MNNNITIKNKEIFLSLGDSLDFIINSIIMPKANVIINNSVIDIIIFDKSLES